MTSYKSWSVWIIPLCSWVLEVCLSSSLYLVEKILPIVSQSFGIWYWYQSHDLEPKETDVSTYFSRREGSFYWGEELFECILCLRVSSLQLPSAHSFIVSLKSSTFIPYCFGSGCWVWDWWDRPPNMLSNWLQDEKFRVTSVNESVEYIISLCTYWKVWGEAA